MEYRSEQATTTGTTFVEGFRSPPPAPASAGTIAGDDADGGGSSSSLAAQAIRASAAHRFSAAEGRRDPNRPSEPVTGTAPELDLSYNAHDNCHKTDNPTSNISSESIASSLHHIDITIKKSLHSTMSGRGRNEELEEENHRNPFLSTNTFKLSSSKLQFRKELSRARWDEELEMGEIVEKKGSMWATTGIIRNGKLYCRIEEILFMSERGALLLSDSDDTILSIKDIYKKIANLKYGCYWDSFEAYRHLKSLGYIVGWYGIPWTMKSSVGCGSSGPRQSTPDGNGRFCQQVENKLSNLFKDMQLDELKPTFSVYLPNSKFRKSTPGDPSFLLCVLRGNPPSRVEVESMEEKCDGLPLKFCFVDHGRISFFSYDKISLPILP
ncbi:uncharacterized protein M6B38_207980 [Iris pallida]|uniref:tRNA-splicing endonuclease subunit Sen54 N-terminal domain-containing protein n=1 Tax=Iris pallida TaxID=29817 RepID=A0AAX6E5H1_IRIPA|nr:uncharacterized protein M6B38_207980 [Iris pallida]